MKKVILFFAGIFFLSHGYGQRLNSSVLFPSNNSFGVIGTEESRPDNPADNIFHVQINEKLNPNEKIWLVYELDGVEDHTSVSRSINDQLSIGGYLVKKRTGYLEQRERINISWLRQGDNIVRFTVPSEATHFYKVRNLRIEVAQEAFEQITASELIIETASYKEQVYIKGFVSGQTNGNTRIFIAGVETALYNGEFENILKGKNKIVLVEAVLENGQRLSKEVTLNSPKLPDFQFAFSSPSASTQKFFDKEKEEQLTLSNTLITAPAGALKNNANISITPLREVDIPALDAGMVNVTGGASGYRFLPHRSIFEKELILEMGYDPEKIPEGYTEKDIRTYYFDEETHHWVALPYDSSDADNFRVHARTNHFTDVINSIIKVPESPEAEAYNSTSMKGIKAANPTAGINLIEAPSANNMGTANLSYPLNLPSGRNGLQPQLGISYNSGGGNGWLGLGWNLQIPSITIETRWGSPRYSAGQETETYLLNGEQLTPLAHRSELVTRTSEKQFYPRVEGSFNKIIRHGNSPKNYWWEVIDKNGTRYFYGGKTGLDASAVLADDNGNIAHWALLEVRDLNGNHIRYEYNKVTDKGMSEGTVNGFQIYIRKIYYTGSGANNGKYEVEFTTDRILNEARRADVIISGNYGFKEVTADLLRKIKVSFGGQTVRSYELVYTEGAFRKTLLNKIKEFDAAGNFFNEHEFSYFDDVRDSGGNYQPFKTTGETWDPGKDGIKAPFVSPINGFNGDVTALNGTKSTSFDFGMVVSVGLNDGSFISKSLTVGGSFGYTRSSSKGILSMIDINGDGLPDKVMMDKQDGVSYRLNQSGTTGNTTFGEPIPVNGINNFYKEKSNTFGGGLQANFFIFAGFNTSTTKSTTTIYFTDVNGDQLIDIVIEGKVFFNSRIAGTETIQFTPSSGDTPSPIFAGGAPAADLFEVNPQELEDAINANPLHDMVRMWEAPFDGTISIDAPFSLIQSTDPDRPFAPADGVRLAVQHKGSELWNATIAPDNYQVQPLNLSSIAVARGDRIYFRIQSIFNGEYDKIAWDPKIEYTDNGKDLAKEDANGRKKYIYRASEDFLLSMDGQVGMPVNGKIRLQGTFSKPRTSDNIHVEIIENTTNTIIWQRDYTWHSSVNDSYDLPLNVLEKQNFSFKATTSTGIDWPSIKWENYIFYTASTDPKVPNVFDPDGKPLLEFYPTPYFTVFSAPFKDNAAWLVPGNGQVTVTPLWQFDTQEKHSGDIEFSLKHQNRLLHKKTITIEEDTISNADSLLYAPVASLKELYIELHAEDTALAGALIKSNVEVKFEMSEEIKFAPGDTSATWTSHKEGTVYINPLLQFNSVPNGTLTVTVTRGNGETVELIYPVSGGIVPDDTLEVPVDSLEQILIVYTLSKDLKDALTSTKAHLYFMSIDTLAADIHIREKEVIFGSEYRSWGHFGYNGNKDKANNPINEALLVINTQAMQSASEAQLNTSEGSSDEATLANLESSQNVYEPGKADFMILIPDSKNNQWMGFDNYAWLKADSMSSSRMGLDDLTQDNPIPSNAGSGAWAIKKITKSNVNSFSIGGSIPIGDFAAGGSYSKSFGKSRSLADFMDMNGDRYPDIVTEDKIQYTNALGGFLDYAVVHDKGENHFSRDNADGVSVSGSYVNPKAESAQTNVKAGKVHVGNGKVGAGISGNYGRSSNETEYTWMDVNGDGLPDRLYKEDDGLYVSLNIGYSFLTKEKWSFGQISEGASKSYGAGLGITWGNGSYSVGVGLSRSDNLSKKSLQDINGDGLTDLLELTGSGTLVNLNTGSSFTSAINWVGADYISKASSASEFINGSFTVCFGLPVPPIKICVNPSINIGQGASGTKQQISDIDGDGFPDYLTSDNEDQLTVKLSAIGRTNMLKSVKRPLGASFTMDYKREGNTYNMPNDVWTLSVVEVSDGFSGDGADRMKNTFVYEDGFYERHERDFYGFKKVHIRSHDTENSDALYTESVQEFENSNYYEKGLALRETLADKDGNLYSEKKNTYSIQDVLTGLPLSADALKSATQSIFPALASTESLFYEGESQAGKSTSMTYKYDQYGNMTEYNDFGDNGSGDDIKAVVTYHQNATNHLIGIPKTITVYGSDGKVYRKRSSVIDLNTGNLTNLKQYLEDGTAADFDMQYNSFGNLTKITRPANVQGLRFSLQYTYDLQVSSYIIKTQNSYGYISEADYDFRFGQKTKSKDINNQLITYKLDDKGRIIQIIGPYEQQGNGYTLKFAYHHDATVPWAFTEHFDPAFPNNTMQTSIFVDGLGRVLQTKKDGSLYTGEETSDEEKMIVSGRVLFDAFGRTTKAWYPVTETLGNAGTFNSAFDNIQPTKTEYDVLGRALKTILSDGAVTQMEYGFDSDRDGKQQFKTLVTDANGIKTEQFTDVKGSVTATKNQNGGTAVWTSFVYNAINELTSSTDDLSNTTTHEYDMLGRKIRRLHPDAGETTYQYDLASNLTATQTANLKQSSGLITYGYEFERLISVKYPQNPQNNVNYHYGAPSAQYNRAGRVSIQEDASGAQEFFYGPLGEVVKNIRTVMIPGHDELTFTSEFTYDTWNRMTQMIYPDGEKVSYTYNTGGLLQSMKGVKDGLTYKYIDKLGYDKFEQRAFLAYGNGTKTAYSYEADRRRLHNMTAQTSGKRVFMDNFYGYDKTSNILSLENKAPVPSSNLMGGASKYTYEYDDLYRLTEAKGSFTGSNHEHQYALQMEYNTVGGIIKKQQAHGRKSTGDNNLVSQKKTTYTMNYDYGEASHPHAPTHIGEKTYIYDANGNQTGWDHDVSGQRRRMIWDEENRLSALSDNGATSHYIYDAQGIRVLKSNGSGQHVHLNAKPAGGGGGVGNFNVYVNPYLVLKSGSYTKHFYIESQRIVSKLGDSPNLGKSAVKAGQGTVDYTAKKGKIWESIVKNLKFLGEDGEILTAGNSGKIPPGQINGSGSSGNNEQFRFFYHPDHVGSTSYITDAGGEVYQHLEYFAFGETFVEEHSNTNRTPYLFNGKELDEETGLYYYGARYYDPITSVFISSDPLADKYPGWSPFVYAFNNPLRYSDPTGMEGNDETDKLKEGAKKGVEAATSSQGGTDGNAPAACNVGVRSAVETITESKALYPKSMGGEVKGGAGQANDIGTALKNNEISNFEPYSKPEWDNNAEQKWTDIQTAANNGEIIIGVYNSNETGGGGHVVMFVPGDKSIGNSWKGGGEVPQVMDTGKNSRSAQTPLTTVSGKTTVNAMKFYRYTGNTNVDQNSSVLPTYTQPVIPADNVRVGSGTGF